MRYFFVDMQIISDEVNVIHILSLDFCMLLAIDWWVLDSSFNTRSSRYIMISVELTAAAENSILTRNRQFFTSLSV